MNNNRGLTLIEVVIAVGLIGLAIGVASQTSKVIGQTYNNSARMVKAHDIAVQLMEQLLAVFSSDTKLTSGAHTQAYDPNGNMINTAGYYTATWTVSVDTPITKVMKIDLMVSWLDFGQTRSVHFQTFKSE